MNARWITQFLSYATVSTSVLRATLMSFSALDIFPEQRAAIARELAVRAWAHAVEARLSWTIGWCRGGRS